MDVQALAAGILALSLALQLLAAWFAIRLIGLTGHRFAWSLITLAVVLMAARRGISLLDYISGRPTEPYEIFTELLAFLISVSMAWGLASITPLFQELKAMGERLRQGERRYRSLFENSPIPLWEADFSQLKAALDALSAAEARDPEGYLARRPDFVQHCAGRWDVLDANQAALRFLQAQTTADLRQGLTGIFSPQSFGAFSKLLLAVWKGERELATDALVQTVDGEPRQVALKWLVLPGYEGSFGRVSISLVDFTEQRRMEASLRENEFRFRDLVENWPDEIARYDRDCRRVYVNPCMETVVGPASQLLGLRPTESYPDSPETAFYEEKLREVLATGQVQEFEMGWGSPAVQPRCRLLRLAPERDENGEIRGVFAIARDISERKQAEEALREREADLRQLMEQSPVAMALTVGEDEKVILFNRKFTELFGYTLEDIPDVSHWWPLAYPDPVYREEIKARWQAAVAMAMQQQDPDVAPIEALVTCKDGSRRLIEFRASAIAGRNIVTLVDLTQRQQAEQAVQKREREFRALAENLPDMVARFDESGRHLYVNPNVCRTFGEPPEHFIGRTVAEISLPGQAQIHTQLHESILRAFREGIPNQVQVRWPLPQGLRDFEIRYVPEKDESGRVLSVLGLARDISEYKTIERQLRSLVENLPDLVARFDVAGRHLYVNPAAVAVSGRTLDHLMGKTPLDLDEPATLAHREALYEAVLRVAGRGEPEALESPRPTPLGERIFSYSLFPERDETGAVVSVLSLGHDITERVAVSKILMHYAAIVESSDDAIIGKDLEGRITSWNKGATQIFGYTPDEMVGLPISSALIPEAYRDEERMILDQIRQGQTVKHYETVRCCKGGRLIDVSVTVSPLRDSHGKVVGASKIARDVTERRKVETELIRYRDHLEELVTARTEALEAANRELEAFSYSVSHDLRTPLRAIDGFSRMLANKYEQQLDEEARRLIAVVRDNTARMSQLIDDILAFSRTGRTELKRSQVDMGKLLSAAWTELEPARAGRDIRLEVKELPPAWADANLLRQVWINLLANAVKFSQPRAVAHIEVGGAEEGREVLYYVKDDGVGFDPAYSHKLFGVFQRLHGVKEFEGTGIGLAIVKRVVTRHGGRVMAEGQVGGGATFRFSLPSDGNPRGVRPSVKASREESR